MADPQSDLWWATPPTAGQQYAPTGDASAYEQLGITRHLQAAADAMRLTPQEIALYMRHLHNLYGPGGVDQPGGARSSLLAGTFSFDNGRTYLMPTLGGGRVYQPGTPDYRAFVASQGGPSTFPSYPSVEAADARYRLLHDYMERDTRDYFARRAMQQPLP